MFSPGDALRMRRETGKLEWESWVVTMFKNEKLPKALASGHHKQCNIVTERNAYLTQYPFKPLKTLSLLFVADVSYYCMGKPNRRVKET